MPKNNTDADIAWIAIDRDHTSTTDGGFTVDITYTFNFSGVIKAPAEQ